MEGQVHAGATHTTQELGKTGNPLVIKGVERIESILLPRQDVRLDAELRSHVISRVMRRDFNLTSVKLFWYTKGFNRRLNAQRMLLDLQAEAERLEDLARPYEMPCGPLVATCSMRIISEEAQLLFDALMLADRSLYKLMHSPLAEVAEDNMYPFLRSFTILRKGVFGFFDDQRQRSDTPENIRD
jgi:hypothetical protein